ncbi:MAG: hypothetical protein J6K39_04205 [Clostridia bacterium]|nr:hypothetical protein [Clostridia bacterium]
MDRLVAEKETLTKEAQPASEEVKVQSQPAPAEQKQPETDKLKELPKQEVPINMQYLNSFKNMTVADIKREEEQKKQEDFKEEKKVLLEKQFEKVEQKNEFQIEENTNIQAEEETKKQSVNIIEKPNYDLLEENKKIVKLKKASPQKKVRKKKFAGIMLACALAASAIICVTNCVLIDNLNSNYLQIEDTYKLNLRKYLQDITKLDTTKKSMEMIETYPEELLDAGELGQKTNWFDRLCNFLGGLFGG